MNIEKNIPDNWDKLSDKQLKYIFNLISKGFSTEESVALAFFWFTGIKILAKNSDRSFDCLINGKYVLKLTPHEVVVFSTPLDFIKRIPPLTINFSPFSGYETRYLNDLEDCSFETFLMMENYYQGYIATERNDILTELRRLLFKKKHLRMRYKNIAAVNIAAFYWFSAIKVYILDRYRNLFSTSTTNEPENIFAAPKSQKDMLQESMDAQIRALTKGDVTKEKEILKIPVHRALTELDALAREYRQLKKI